MVWRELIGAGAVPAGLEAYEVLRVKEGAPVYDRELGDDYNPLEAGLWGSISFTKGCYIGQEVIARLDTYQKLQKHLVSLSFSSEAGIDAGVRLSREGREVGQVTSAARVPTTGATIGLGYVRKEAAEVRDSDGPPHRRRLGKGRGGVTAAGAGSRHLAQPAELAATLQDALVLWQHPELLRFFARLRVRAGYVDRAVDPQYSHTAPAPIDKPVGHAGGDKGGIVAVDLVLAARDLRHTLTF